MAESNFEKEFEKVIWHPETAAGTPLWYYDEIKYLKGISRHFYLTALKWALDNAVRIHSSEVAEKIIEFEQDLKEIELLANICYKNRKQMDEFLQRLQEIWWMPDWGFVLKGRNVLKLVLHTGGWSGNEEIIDVLQKTALWYLYWEKSIRGGHYCFDIKILKKQEKK